MNSEILQGIQTTFETFLRQLPYTHERTHTLRKDRDNIHDDLEVLCCQCSQRLSDLSKRIFPPLLFLETAATLDELPSPPGESLPSLCCLLHWRTSADEVERSFKQCCLHYFLLFIQQQQSWKFSKIIQAPQTSKSFSSTFKTCCCGQSSENNS